jgi:hypothetical protein
MTPHRPKTGMASLEEAEFGIRKRQLPFGDVRESRRVARVVHRRGASMSLAHRISSFCNSELETKMLHVASLPPGRSRHSHSLRIASSLDGAGIQCGVVVGCAPPRAPPQWPGGSILLTTTTMALTAWRNARAGSCQRANDGPT